MSEEQQAASGEKLQYRPPAGGKVRARERLQAYLDERRTKYQTRHHPLAYTAQQVANCERIPSAMLAKVVMIMADGSLLMLVIPASHHVDLPGFAELLGAREVRLAAEREFKPSFPDCEPGAMPPFGNLYHVPVYVDWLLAENDQIVVQAGTHEDTISLRYADYVDLVKPIPAHLVRNDRELPAVPRSRYFPI